MFLSWCRTMHLAPARLPLTPGFWNDGNSQYGAAQGGSRPSGFQKLTSQAVRRRNMRRLGKL